MAGESPEQPAKMLSYYAASPLPHLISPDFSWIQRFFACIELNDEVIITTKLWPIGRHDVFVGSRFKPITARRDENSLWVTFAAGSMRS